GLDVLGVADGELHLGGVGEGIVDGGDHDVELERALFSAAAGDQKQQQQRPFHEATSRNWSAVAPSTRSVFLRPVSPRRISTLLLDTPSSFPMKARSASLAAPSTGGAVSCTL